MLTDARRISSGSPLDEGPQENAVFADFRAKIVALGLSDAREQELLDQAAAALEGPESWPLNWSTT